MTNYINISVADAKNSLQMDNLLILDCRTTADYKAGHLENALHLHDGLRESLVKRGDKQRTILIYCYHGHASQHVAQFFADFGFSHVYSLEGGYTAWQQSSAS